MGVRNSGFRVAADWTLILASSRSKLKPGRSTHTIEGGGSVFGFGFRDKFVCRSLSNLLAVKQ